MSQDMVFPCPVDVDKETKQCGKSFSTPNGAVMHTVNMQDEYHDMSKPKAYRVLDSLQTVESATEPNSDVATATIPDPDPDPDTANGAVDVDGGQEAGDVDGQEAAHCPECGDDLGMTEAEAHQFIQRNGGAWCESCGAHLVVDHGS